ncbi:MarR family transcriptional regulator [Sinorhizobium fredii]|uniref:MarR family transcriptional regulator n=1 Tax=Rhizobium fredii TaxID=380 RepID=A0A2A6M6D0_RHIFR|nr:MarR family transcriptional regulator [Sinorhizobium fredii]PDT50107.1 MarR family transcriptional regulator [Sinorhizobium fredii]
MSDFDENVGAFRLPDLVAAETGRLLPQQEAYLYLIRAAEVLSGPVADLLQAHGLSGKQYNALRAIRRAGDKGATVNEIRHQMTDPRADVTRLIDRLERDGLAVRRHDSEDRRVVRILLSGQGKKLLNDIDEPLLQVHQSQFGRFKLEELEMLKSLLTNIF